MKRILAIVVLASLLLVTVGCSSSSSPAPTSTAAPSANTSASAPVAQLDWPKRDITFIIPFSAGGGTDLVGRAIADGMSRDLGVNVVVENKPGGGSLVGIHEAIAKPADGYTMCLVTDSLSTSPYASESGVTLDMYTPLAQVTTAYPTISIDANLPYNTLQEFIDAAKEQPGKFRIAMSGSRGVFEVFAQRFEDLAGIEMIHVPYDSGNEASLAIAGGHIECAIVSSNEIIPLLETGNVKILCIFAPQRDKLIPDVPTGKEAGIDYVDATVRGIILPKGVDQAVLDRLSVALESAIAEQSFLDFLDSQGFNLTYLDQKGYIETLQEKDAAYKAVYESWG